MIGLVWASGNTIAGFAMHKPADGFVEEDPQPIYGVDVTDLKPADAATIDDSATSFPVKLSELPPTQARASLVGLSEKAFLERPTT